MLKQLAGQTAIYGVGTIVPRFLNYLLFPYLTRLMTTGEYGVVTDLYALIPFALVVLTMGLETGYFRFAGPSHHRAGTQGSVRDDMGRRLAVRAAVFRRSPAFYPCAGSDYGLCRASVVHPADGGHHRARRRDGHSVRPIAAARTCETFRRAEAAVGRRQFGAYRLFLFGAPRFGKPRSGRRYVRPGIRSRLRTGGQPIGQRGRMDRPVSQLSRRTAAHTAQAVARGHALFAAPAYQRDRRNGPTSSSTGR